MLPSLARALIAVVLALSIGLHWTLLQTVAWAGMVVSYSKDASLTEAIGKTFDGQHPCNLCTEIDKAKKTEKKRDAKPELKKINLLNDLDGQWVFSPSTEFYLVHWPEPSAPAFNGRPPAPPPRRSSANGC